MKTRRSVISSGMAAALFPLLARAQRSMRIVLGFGAGGTMDLLARETANQLAAVTGQPLVVENRTGANGSLAGQAVAAGAADGSMLYMTTSSSQTLLPLVSKGAPYEVQNDFVPLATVARAPLVLCVSAENSANTLQELVTQLKSASAPSFGSAGAAQTMHVAGLMLQDAAGVPLIHVPFKGEMPAITELIGGRISFVFATVSGAIPLLKGGRIKALAVADTVRSPALAAVPTAAEAGMPQIELVVSYLMMVKKGTPAPVLARLEQETMKALSTAEMNSKILSMGITPQILDAKGTDGMLRRDSGRFKALVEKFKITLE